MKITRKEYRDTQWYAIARDIVQGPLSKSLLRSLYLTDLNCRKAGGLLRSRQVVALLVTIEQLEQLQVKEYVREIEKRMVDFDKFLKKPQRSIQESVDEAVAHVEAKAQQKPSKLVKTKRPVPKQVPFPFMETGAK